MARRKAQPAQTAPANDASPSAGWNDASPEEAPEPEELAPAVAPPPAPRAPRATPRRVSAEVVKAETKLLALERRRQESLAHHERAWAEKRVTLILGFPADVSAALVAMGVLTEEDSR